MPSGVYKRTEEHKKKSSKANKGRRFSPATEFKKGSIPWNKGLKGWTKNYKNAGFQKGHKYLGGGGKKGKRNSPSTEFKKGAVPWNKGLYGVMKAWNKGLGNGTKTARAKEMATWQYALWRKRVFERDDYTCQHCGKRGGKLIADHIKMWCLYPKLRYVVDNGQTLCQKCSLEKTRKEMSLYWKNQYSKAQETASGLYSGAKNAIIEPLKK